MGGAQRAIVLNDRRETLSRLAVTNKLEKARAVKSGSMEVDSASIEKEPKERTRKAISAENKISERKLRQAAEKSKDDSTVALA